MCLPWLLLTVYTYPFAVPTACAAVTNAVEPGVAYQLDYRWRAENLTRRTFVQPHLDVRDANGRTIWRREIGLTQQRVFLPDDLAVECWRIVALPAASPGLPKVGAAGFEGVCTVQLPPNARQMILSLAVHGERAEPTDVRLSATKTMPQPHKGCSFPPLPAAAIQSDAAIDAALAARTRPLLRTRTCGDRTEVEVDGKPVRLKIYKNCPWDMPHRSRVSAVFAEKGFNAFTVDATLSDYWKADGSVDATPFRKKLRKILSCNPSVYLFIELNIRPPAGWGEKNPDEVFRCEAGRYALFTHGRVCAFTDRPTDDPKRKAYAAPSYLSGKYAAEGAAAIRAFFATVETWPESKALVGAYLNSGTDGQWLDLFDHSVLSRPESADYSVVSQRRFDDWRRAHGRPPVPIPSTAAFRTTARVDFGEHAVTPESDWREFYATTAAETKLAFARAVKDASGRRLLVGSYSPQTGLAGYPLLAQTAAWKLIQSPDWDFFAVVPNYVREPVDPVISAIYDATCVRHAKLFVSELDLRSGDVGNWGHWGSDLWRSTHTAATFRQKVLHYACYALTRGGTYHAYDMDGGWFNTPAAQETWRCANRVADAARSQSTDARGIALVLGERFFDFRSQSHGHMLAYALREMPRAALATAGVPYGVYLLDDVLADPTLELPRVVLMADPTTLDERSYREIRRRFARDGRVLVWFGEPGVYSTSGAAIARDLGLVAHPEADGRWIVADASSDDPLMAGVRGIFASWYPYYADGIIFPPARIPANWKPLAAYAGSRVPALSVRRENGCTEVHVANPGQLHEAFLRNLVREAGIAPLLETGDISGFGSGLFYILATAPGEKPFRLPPGFVAGETLAGPAYRTAATGYSVTLARGEVFVLSVAHPLPITSTVQL